MDGKEARERKIKAEEKAKFFPMQVTKLVKSIGVKRKRILRGGREIEVLVWFGLPF